MRNLENQFHFKILIKNKLISSYKEEFSGDLKEVRDYLKSKYLDNDIWKKRNGDPVKLQGGAEKYRFTALPHEESDYIQPIFPWNRDYLYMKIVLNPSPKPL